MAASLPDKYVLSGLGGEDILLLTIRCAATTNLSLHDGLE